MATSGLFPGSCAAIISWPVRMMARTSIRSTFKCCAPGAIIVNGSWKSARGGGGPKSSGGAPSPTRSSLDGRIFFVSDAKNPPTKKNNRTAGLPRLSRQLKLLLLPNGNPPVFSGAISWNSCGHSQFPGRGHPPEAGVSEIIDMTMAALKLGLVPEQDALGLDRSGVAVSLLMNELLHRGVRESGMRTVMSSIKACSSSDPLGRRLCVGRCCPSTRQTRRSDCFSSDRTCSMQARRRAGFRNFPMLLPSRCHKTYFEVDHSNGGGSLLRRKISARPLAKSGKWCFDAEHATPSPAASAPRTHPLGCAHWPWPAHSVA